VNDAIRCPRCGEPIAQNTISCTICGLAVLQDAEQPTAPSAADEEMKGLGLGADGSRGGLHPLAPLFFILAGVLIGILATLALGPTLGVPLGLLGGGLGVWAVERGRRLR